ncbi:MAG: N-acetylglucosamine kinase, partial [Bacteroidota bacterium]|nr:N-acetylglucosamine kinase [Bacteroidota bacterium]
MILIADSGSSKTHWRAVKNKKIVNSFTTIGLNPYFINADLIANVKKEIAERVNLDDISKLHFYSAGCSGE